MKDQIKKVFLSKGMDTCINIGHKIIYGMIGLEVAVCTASTIMTIAAR